MTILRSLVTWVASLAACVTFAAATSPAEPLSRPLDPVHIVQTLKRAADWQLENPNGTDLRNWVIAPLYDGLMDLSEVTGDPRYLAAVVRFGIQSAWMPGNEGWNADMHAYFADNHAVGHAWLDVYLADPSKKERLLPLQKQFDEILARPIEEPLVFGTPPKQRGVSFADRWTWCDALYMAPPTLARLAKATGDARYLDFLDAEYRYTLEMLFDPTEKLFYRDSRFITRKSANGKKIFWSRGNGWVFAGLPLLIEALPADRPSRKVYSDLLQEMAPAVAAAQQADGLWRPSLLDPAEVDIGETSGSAFFVYGLAWGVNHGLLERERYWPVVERGWNALLTRITPEGLVGYVQRIGDAPAKLDSHSTQLYGTGAVLMAGSEILRGLGAATSPEPAALLAQAEQLLANDRAPRAYARLLPERKDDLAWENDKGAYRIYGPALRAGPEASGIDVWAKRVARPVIDTWYADDLAGRRSYHKDHGEGYDGYKVGDSAGCGGIAIWHDGQRVGADVYDRAMILFSKPGTVEIEALYTYPKINGTAYYERRLIRLRQGSRLNEIVSRFSLDWAGRRPAANLEVAVGLAAQTPRAKHVLLPESGVMGVWDALQPGGEPFGIGAVVAPGSKMLRQAHTGAEAGADHALAILRTNDKGEVAYRAGFGWPGDGEIRSEEVWLRHLESQRVDPLPAH